ncbi:MAG: uracil-DNA glycosylase, partial [Clostridia bacterium]|nr:uracil-DNA glycosylase [Clostridia bacterium]
FTDRIIQEVNKQEKPVVFMLWGRNAINKTSFIDAEKHLVLTSAHPSPLSAYQGFLGNGHFKKANDFLKMQGRTEINWKIEDIKR